MRVVLKYTREERVQIYISSGLDAGHAEGCAQGGYTGCLLPGL